MRLNEIRKGLLSPDRVVKYLRRAARDRHFWASSKNFLDFYSRVVDDNAANINPDLAIGSHSHEHWLEIGRFQFEFLVAHGLRHEHRFLDVGCGNLRLGANLVPYLDELGYVGIDISPRIVTAALDTIRAFKLQSRLPRVFLVSETNYGFFPENYFDVVNAHSVFSHLPIEEIEKVLREAFRILKPGGWFDFTFFNRSEAGDHLREDFYYPQQMMLDVATTSGFRPEPLADWSYSQDKIRATKPN
jgi:SAM-dependent methyltransferase